MGDSELEKFLSAIDTTKFKDYAQAKNRLLIKLILYTGIRVGEALDIKVKEIVLKMDCISFKLEEKEINPALP